MKIHLMQITFLLISSTFFTIQSAEIKDVLSLKDITTSYLNNQIQADASIKGKFIKVNGFIDEITIGNDNRVYVTLKESNIFSLNPQCIKCIFEKESIDSLKELLKGNNVVIEGLCYGLLNNTAVVLTSCELISSDKLLSQCKTPAEKREAIFNSIKNLIDFNKENPKMYHNYTRELIFACKDKIDVYSSLIEDSKELKIYKDIVAICTYHQDRLARGDELFFAIYCHYALVNNISNEPPEAFIPYVERYAEMKNYLVGYNKKTIPCPDCNGRGYKRGAKIPGKLDSTEYTCGKCNGSGSIKE